MFSKGCTPFLGSGASYCETGFQKSHTTPGSPFGRFMSRMKFWLLALSLSSPPSRNAAVGHNNAADRGTLLEISLRRRQLQKINASHAQTLRSLAPILSVQRREHAAFSCSGIARYGLYRARSTVVRRTYVPVRLPFAAFLLLPRDVFSAAPAASGTGGAAAGNGTRQLRFVRKF